MKIGITSDLHLEIEDLDLPNHDNIDVLVLGGDICIAEDQRRFPDVDPKKSSDPRCRSAERYRRFFERCAERFPHVIYVMGNHEHYHGDWNQTESVLRSMVSVHENIHFLEMGSVVLSGVRFIGTTLWTDCNRHDPITMLNLRRGLNDYVVIKNDADRTLTPEVTAQYHDRSLDYLLREIDQPHDGPTVVCTHHCPSRRSTHPRYQDDYHMNGGYSSTLDPLIEMYPQIKLWSHGHTHDQFDYMIGSTRIVCNPRGYAGYERPNDDSYRALVIEI